MDIAFLLFLPVVLWGMGFSGRGFREDYLSLEAAGNLKGILAVLVVLHHMSQKLEGVFLFLLDNVGVLCVGAFFFLSGYGLQRSYCTRPGYRQRIIKRRIPSVLVPYALLCGIYWVFYLWMGTPVDIGWALRSMLGERPVAEYCWYLACILAFYLVYWLSAFVIRPGHRGMYWFHFAFSVAWVFLCRGIGYGYFWYNAAIAFPLGIFWAMEEANCLSWLRRHYWPLLLASVLLFGGAFLGALYTAEGMNAVIPLYWLAIGGFLLTLLLVLMKFSFRNRVLSFLGEISFELYGIHGLFIRLFWSDSWRIENDILRCLAVMACSVAAAWGLHQVFRRLLK